MLHELKYIPTAWKNVRGSKSFRNQLIFAVLLFVLAHLHNFYCLRLWQGRPGIQINDFVLNMMPPMDFSLLIFCVEYSAILLGAAFVLVYPAQFVKGLQMFALMILARTISIYLVALEPPKDMVALYDPVANLFLHTRETFVTKDLFFSGHIGALAIVMFITINKYVKAYIMVATIIVGILLMWQHVHYSSDVLFAPLASYVAYRFVNYIHRETHYGLEVENAQF
jgi:hypothetical protein